MTVDVRDWIKACLPCIRRKTGRPRSSSWRHLIAERPFQLVCIDFVGPMPKTVNGNTYILVMVDAFTRWPIIVACKRRDSGMRGRRAYALPRARPRSTSSNVVRQRSVFHSQRYRTAVQTVRNPQNLYFRIPTTSQLRVRTYHSVPQRRFGVGRN